MSKQWSRTAILLLALLLAVGGAVWFWRQYPRRFLQAGKAALQARRYGEAREQFQQYLASRPNDAHAHLLAARACRWLREYYDAYEHLRRCREAGYQGEAVELEAALIAVQRGEEPTPALRQRAEQDDELALLALEVLIQYDLDTYQLHQALQGLTRYLEARPDDLQARLARGFVWERFLYFADAVEDYRQAVASHPNSERARLKLGETLLLAGTPQDALEQFDWLNKRYPERPEVRLGLARCRRRLGQLEEAKQLLDALANDQPNDGEILWERGQLELDRGNAAAAEPWFRKAATARPYDRRMAYSLSRCLLSLGKNEEAEKWTARVAELDADLKKMDQIRLAVMKRPEDAALRCEGGLLLLKNGEQQEGIRWLKLALRLDPTCAEARSALDRLAK